jgi:hypothetical protein
MKTLFLVLSILVSSNAFAKESKKASKKSAKPPVTIIDMSATPEPEPALPEIVKKGSL